MKFKYEYSPGYYIEELIEREFYGKNTAPDEHGRAAPIPLYSRNFTAAWRMFEKLIKKLPLQDIHLEHIENEWSVSTCYNAESGGWDNWVSGETLEHTLALAVLQWMGYYVMEGTENIPSSLQTFRPQ